MSDSDTETLVSETTSTSKCKLGERGIRWKNKLIHALRFKFKVAKLKADGFTKDEIAETLPEYYYHEDYHEIGILPGFRRTKSFADLSTGVGTSQGYAAWEWCGERTQEGLRDAAYWEALEPGCSFIM